MSTYPYASTPTWDLIFWCYSFLDGADGVHYKYHAFRPTIARILVSEKEIWDAPGHILTVRRPCAFGVICYEKVPICTTHLSSQGFSYLHDASLQGTAHYDLLFTLQSKGLTCAGTIMTGVTANNPTPGVTTMVDELGNTVYVSNPVIPALSQGKFSVLNTNYGSGVLGFYHGRQVVFTFQLQVPGVGWKVIHDSVVRSTVTPADQTPVSDGGSVVITATPISGATLTTFTVDGADELAHNPFLKTDVHADVHVSAAADYSKIPKPATEAISILLHCSTCGPTAWSATGLAALSLSINATTGEISGTIPYGTAAGDYSVVVTLDNGGRIVTRTIIITVTAPAVFGNTFDVVGKVGNGAIYSLCQLANGSILIGTADAAGPKVYKTDILFTAPTDVTGVIEQIAGKAVTSIIQLASGTVLCTTDHIGGSRGIIFRSIDNGDNWTKVLSAGVGTVNAMGIVEHSPTAVYATTGDAVAKLMKSINDGLTWANAFQYSDGLNHYGKKIGKIDGTNIQFTATSTGSGSEIIRTTGAIGVGAVICTDAANSAVTAGFLQCLDSSFLASINAVVYTGVSDGSAWTIRQTMPRNIGCMVRTPNPYQGIIMASFGTAGINTYRSTDDLATYTTPVTGLNGTNARALIQLADGRFLLGADGTTTNLFVSGT